MNLEEYLAKNKTLDRFSFGEFIYQRRLELGISKKDFSTFLEVSPSYICDIEKGSRHAPIRVLKEMANLLNVEESQYDDFIDLAYLSKETIAPDLIQYLISNKEARIAIRKVKENNMNVKELLEIVENYDKNL